VSNKRNRRRAEQRVRSEVDRKPTAATKAQDAFVASLPNERERKERERRLTNPIKTERQAREKRIRRWRLSGPSKVRKPRTNYGRTYWRHSHDV